jgi:plasmid maintenance system antidote protein VapI
MHIQHDDIRSAREAWLTRRQREIPHWVDPAIWDRQDMRYALAVHDICTVFRLLQRHGVSQRRIAARTGQSQSEISEIIGGRRVAAYDLLVRIADGLGIPRGWMGLEFNEAGEPDTER